MTKITVNPKYTKTYKNEENLNKALNAMNLPDDLSYLLYPVGDRVTAIFTNSLTAAKGTYMTFLVHKGFKVVG